MRTSFTNNELAAFRARPQRTIYYLAVHQPASLFSSVIDSTPAVHPASALNIDTAFNVGDATLCSKNMTIWIGSIPGASDEGTIRLREPVSGSVVPIAESGSGINRYYAGKYITIIDQILPWTKHPRFDAAASQWRMDYNENYTNQLTSYGPLVVMGPPLAGFLDGGTITGSFVGSSTQTVIDAISSQKWEFPGGSTDTALGTEAAPVTAQFTGASPGGKYATLTVTDGVSASHAGKRLVYAFNDRTGPARVKFAEVTGGIRKGGYATTVTAHAGVDTNSFPNGAEILIFEESSYAGMASTIGGNYPFRSNVVMRGWIIADTQMINPFSAEVTFNVETINGLLDKAAAFDVFHIHSNAPDEFQPWLSDVTITGTSQWIRADKLSLDRTMIDLVKHRSNVGEVTDVHLGSGILMEEQIVFQALPMGTLWQQMITNYGEKGTRGYVSSDMHSSIWATEDVQISGGSTSIPILMAIEKRDRADVITIRNTHWDSNAQVRMYGFTDTINSDTCSLGMLPVGAESPGDVQAYWGKRSEHSRGIVVPSQKVMTTWSGNWRAKINNNLDNVVVPLAGNLKIDAVPQARVTMSMSSTENPRGFEWNDKTFLPHTTIMQYNNETGTVSTTVQLEASVDGKGGSAITFPDIKTLQPEVPVNPPPPLFGGAVLVFNSEIGTYKYVTTWADANGALTGDGIKDSSGG